MAERGAWLSSRSSAAALIISFVLPGLLSALPPAAATELSPSSPSLGTGCQQETSCQLVPADRPQPAPPNLDPAAPEPIGQGVAVMIRPISSTVFARMRGVSWRPGCIAPSALRYLTFNYWGFDRARHRGELVVATAAARRMAGAMTALYRMDYPFRQVRLVDDFGRARGTGADDLASMRADNTSAFNCRHVAGSANWSVHATGRAIDINPWENPYLHAGRTYPSTAYRDRRSRHPAVINRRGRVVRVMASLGCSWFGETDYQHFECRA